MLIRQDFNQDTKLPPRIYLELIVDTLTKIYIWLWDHKNEDNRIEMTWKSLSMYYNKNSFRTNLRKLNSQGLVSYEESPDGVSIELVGWDEIFDAG